MISLALAGVRGGVGCTSVAAGLAYALHAMHQRVLLVDLAAHNQLRLHFNLALEDSAGWAPAVLAAGAWDGQAWSLDERLCLVPRGELSAAGAARVGDAVRRSPAALRRPLLELADRFDWLLVDCGAEAELLSAVAPFDLRVTLLEADPACAVLLARAADAVGWRLVNRYAPERQLQADLQLLWRRAPGHRFLPFSIHDDAAWPEALALKMPVGHYAPDSQAARDMHDLADWCLAATERAA